MPGTSGRLDVAVSARVYRAAGRQACPRLEKRASTRLAALPDSSAWSVPADFLKILTNPALIQPSPRFEVSETGPFSNDAAATAERAVGQFSLPSASGLQQLESGLQDLVPPDVSRLLENPALKQPPPLPGASPDTGSFMSDAAATAQRAFERFSLPSASSTSQEPGWGSWSMPADVLKVLENPAMKQSSPHFGSSFTGSFVNDAASTAQRAAGQFRLPTASSLHELESAASTAAASAASYLSSALTQAEASVGDAVQSLTRSPRPSSGGLGEMGERASTSASATVEQAWSGLSGLQDKVSQAVAPMTEGLAGRFSQAQGQLAGAVAPLSERWGGGLREALDRLSAATEPLRTGVASGFSSSQGRLTTAAAPLSEGIAGRWGSLQSQLSAATTSLGDGLSGAVRGVGQQLSAAVAPLTDGVAGGGSAVEGWLSEASAPLSGALSSGMTSLARSNGGAGLAPGGSSFAPHFGSQITETWAHTLVDLLKARSAGLPVVNFEALTTVAAEVKHIAADLAGAPAAVLRPVLEPLVNALLTLGDPSALPVTIAKAAAELEASVAAWESSGFNAVVLGGYNLAAVLLAAAGVMALVAATAPSNQDAESDDLYEPPLNYEYSPEVLEVYFRRRPVAVAQRAAAVAAAAAKFGAALLVDTWTNRVKAKEQVRALQARQLIESLGPTYVKVAQALSTRVDLMPAAYFQQIQNLQDRVPPFPSEEARAVMTKTFGRKPETVFSAMSATPVAAASLGQVYRAVLNPALGGGEVAVKVQRPRVLEQVALDLYLIRQLALAVPQLADDWPPVIDNWAVRFFHEMDYSREAANSVLFAEQMASLEGIMVPRVRKELSSVEVLVTDWVQGEKLSESRASDVRELCSTLLTAYLIQLLETGFLHADPHPGNLIRTPDGKICILDYGLMTEVTPEQRIALVEYIAHLSTADWRNVALDLKTLGFIPDSVTDPQQAGLVEPLGRILSQLVGGGGAAKVNIDKVVGELEQLGKLYPFQIPPFFALVLRAFSVIEGIALTVDPDYAIVRECFPYLSRRLLSDDSPRVRKALRDVLYGGKQRLDMERLVRLADGLQSYTTDGLVEERDPSSAVRVVPGTGNTQQVQVHAPLLDDSLVDVLMIVFNKRGSYVQELLVEEAVAAADALSREALSEMLRMVLGSLPATVTSGVVASLGPLRPVLLPVPTFTEVLARLVPAVAVTPEDQEALGVVRGVLALAQRLSPPPSTSAQYGLAARRRDVDFARVAAQAGPLLEKLSPGLLYTGEMFARAFFRRIMARMASGVSLTSEYQSSMSALGMMGKVLPIPIVPLSSAAAPVDGLRKDTWGGSEF